MVTLIVAAALAGAPSGHVAIGFGPSWPIAEPTLFGAWATEIRGATRVGDLEVGGSAGISAHGGQGLHDFGLLVGGPIAPGPAWVARIGPTVGFPLVCGPVVVVPTFGAGVGLFRSPVDPVLWAALRRGSAIIREARALGPYANIALEVRAGGAGPAALWARPGFVAYAFDVPLIITSVDVGVLVRR